MSTPDLTRWNRAGLGRLRYVDGNAATYLEDLRRSLGAAFPNWQPMATPPPVGETEAQRIVRLLEQYHGERGDWGWELARCLARATHVLTEHVDAYANESTLGTATEWENVRHLVEMLGYHVAPPASASTRLVIEAAADGVLAKGFQVQHVPADGGAPVVFETLTALEVSPALDALRLVEWNRSPAPIGPVPGTRFCERSATDLRGVPPIPFTVVEIPGSSVASTVSAGLAEALVAATKTRTRLVLGLAPPASLVETYGHLSLAQLASSTDAELAELRDHLRLVREAVSDSAFAAVRLEELTHSGQSTASTTSDPAWDAGADSGLSAGSLAIVVRDTPSGAGLIGARLNEIPLNGIRPNEAGPLEAAVVVELAAVSPAGAVTLTSKPYQDPAWRYWPRGASRLLADPREIRRVLAQGQGVTELDVATGLVRGDVVAWPGTDGWTLTDVVEADGTTLRFVTQPPAGVEVYRAAPIVRQPSGQLLFPIDSLVGARREADGFAVLSEAESNPVEQGAALELSASSESEIYVVANGAQRVATVAASSISDGYRFAGVPGALTGGQWVVGDDGERLHALKIRRVETFEDHFALVFDSPPMAVSARLRQPVGILHSNGDQPTGVLEVLGIRTIGDLVANQPDVAVLAALEVTPFRFREWQNQAEIVAGFDVDRQRFSMLLDSEIEVLLAQGAPAIAVVIQQPIEEVEGLLSSLRLLRAAISEDTFRSSTLDDWGPALETVPLRRIYGPFGRTLQPAGWDRNDTPVAGDHLQLEGGLAELLVPGRELVIEQQNSDGSAGLGQVSTLVGRSSTEGEIVISPGLDATADWTVGNTVVRGNVVLSGHGEARPARVLGSGDSSTTGQSFVIEEEELSFVADATQPTGVRADLEVTVGDRIWQQVPTLNDSGPTDAHYTVRMTEDGTVRLAFGDGRRGRRLPTGSNNVRVRYRTGSGLAGNLEAGLLTRPIRPHVLVDAVRQLLPATGGNDMESAESMRRGGPASVLTLERAVSLSDFTHLASRQSSVWQARAFARPGGYRGQTQVEVVVVPAGGGALGPLATSLTGFLQRHAAPGISVTVSPYTATLFGVQVTVRVRSAEYRPEAVLETVRATLLQTFSLQLRGLGQPVYLSEIYQVVESVSGVENSQCVFTELPGTRRLTAAPEAVLTLEPALAELVSEEFFL